MKCGDQEECMNPALCRAQAEDFCLKVYNQRRHEEYVVHTRAKKKVNPGSEKNPR